jgi:hypothetical protein
MCGLKMDKPFTGNSELARFLFFNTRRRRHYAARAGQHAPHCTSTSACGMEWRCASVTTVREPLLHLPFHRTTLARLNWQLELKTLYIFPLLLWKFILAALMHTGVEAGVH